MEGRFHVGSSSRAATQEGPRAIPAAQPERQVRPWQFVGEFQQLMGDSAEPDPLFFVESWTLGMAAATENLRRRRYAGPVQQERNYVDPVAFVESHTDAELHSMGQIFAAAAGYGLPHIADSQTSQTESEAPQEQEWQRLAEEYERNGDRIEPMTPDRACHVLGVSSSTDRAQLKAAYRHKVSQWHPDRLQRRTERERRLATQQMAAINEAYHLLRKSA